MHEEFLSIEEKEPRKGQYCEIKVISYFKGWYLPECEAWSWLMDEAVDPTSHVEAWRQDPDKTGVLDE